MKWKNSLKDKLPEFNRQEIDNLFSLISIKEIEFVVKSISTKKTPGLDGFMGAFQQIFQDETSWFSTNFSRKLKRRNYFSNHL